MTEIILMSDPRVAAIELRECGEPLVDARTDGPALLVDDRRAAADPRFAHLRTGVLERLLDAASRLPDGVRLALVEGYRPPELQRRYFGTYRERLRAEGRYGSEAELHEATSRYVAPPSVAPHTSGAAADLTLIGVDGQELDLGTAVNATPEESDGACYTAALSITPRARENRRLLGDVLRAAGMVNYPTEWWHWSYGDHYWALATGAPHALYGPREP
ncbi:M15 family metallopeptidase [Streptomyces spiramenti]|uniref:D-alanyl-D-alanine dipeptidase n=1 Tax=Streptomyces spiramenti TaxID=2720606 RepID=A0ABX1AIL9_9ACTN|nr:M15 family metallopeptidase [Streptomyces spiramenti]NJP66997.1 M15 family metallopeptidase [Streptomyces spiramenti]